MDRMALAAGAVCLAGAVFAAGASGVPGRNRTIYPYPMDPAEHPDYLRHYARAPGRAVFGDRARFISLRNLSGPDYRERIAQWVDRNRLGDVLWPRFDLLFQDNLKEVVAEIKRRDLYLFDLWGYIPGSGPGPRPDSARQFIIPRGALDLFRRELGDHWLGMDIGEQDGRYVIKYAEAMRPMGGGRRRQYLNFQHHFQEMGEQMGNRLVALVALPFGHYLLKEGVYTLIGAETANAHPNCQVYYAFIRGAGKQYGVPWFGNASVWNRWGFKSYAPEYNSPEKGASLSLLKRLLYTHLFYGCVAAGFESMRVDGGLCPIARIQQEGVKWSEKHGSPGTMYTPVAFLADFFSGWSVPGYVGVPDRPYRVWGNLPYEKPDYLTDNMLDILYPGYQNSGFHRDERGFLTPTPFGDVADFLLSDAPLWLLRRYPLLVVAGGLAPRLEIKDKLERYVREGGRLVITSGPLKGLPGGLAGASVKGSRLVNAAVSCGGREIREAGAFALAELSLPPGAETAQACGGLPAVAEIPFGRGRVSVIASPYGLPELPQCALPVKADPGRPLPRPYPMLRHVRAYMEKLFAGLALFETDPALSLVTCVKNRREYSVLITNSGWTPRPFSIRSKIGRIASIRELPINEDEMKAAGYAPGTAAAAAPGRNAPGRIAGGGTRAFAVTVADPQVDVAEKTPAAPNPSGRALTLRDIRSLKEEILSRPTFFEHFDRAVVDWRYLEERDADALAAEAGWLGRQRLKISVDLSPGLNLFPDLRIVNNDGPVYRKSMKRIGRVIDKMRILGADELIVSSQPDIETNFTVQDFDRALVESLRALSDYARPKGIRLLYRMAARRFRAESVADAIRIVRNVGRPNFLLAPSAALLLFQKNGLDGNLQALRQAGAGSLILAAPRLDANGKLWDVNAPLHKCGDRDALAKILTAFPKTARILDGLYPSPDDEYLDVLTLTGRGGKGCDER